jgi:hypothetical protein
VLRDEIRDRLLTHKMLDDSLETNIGRLKHAGTCEKSDSIIVKRTEQNTIGRDVHQEDVWKGLSYIAAECLAGVNWIAIQNQKSLLAWLEA